MTLAFRIIFRDTSGSEETPGTPAERAMRQRIGSTDLAIVSYSTLVPQSQTTTIPLTKLYNPHVASALSSSDGARLRCVPAAEPSGMVVREW